MKRVPVKQMETQEKLREKAEDLVLANTISNAVDKGKSIDGIMRLLSKEIKKIFKECRVSVYLLDDIGENLIVKNGGLPSVVAKYATQVGGQKIKITELELKKNNVYEKVIRERKPSITNDSAAIIKIARRFVDNPQLEKSMPAILKKLGIATVVLVPLVSGEEAIGLIEVSHNKRLTDFDHMRLLTISKQVMASLNRRNAEDEIRRNQQIQIAVSSILRQSLEKSSLDEILRRVLELVFSIPWLGFKKQGCIFLFDENSNSLVMRAQKGLSGNMQKTCQQVPLGSCLCGQAALTQQICFSSYIDGNHERMPLVSSGHGHYCVPILYVNDTIGVLNVYIKEGHRRRDIDEEFLSLVAATLAGVIERKKADEKIIAERDRAQNYLDVAGVMMVALDKRGKVTLVNERGCQILGYEEKEIIGKDWFKNFLPLGIRKEAKETFNQMITGKAKPIRDYEKPVLTQAGEEKIIAWNDTALRENGCIVGTLSSGEDITEKKRYEKDMHRAKDYAELLFRSTPSATFTIDQHRKVTSWNERAQELTGYIPEEVMGKECRLFAAGSCRKKCELFSKDVVKPLLKQECVVVRKDGQLRVVSKNADFLKDHDGNIIGGIESLEDITDRIRAEKNLEKSLEDAKKILGGTVHALAKLAETRDPYTAGHQRKVAILSEAIAKEIGLDEDQMKGIHVAGILHDIGKICVPTEILNKPGRLTKTEFSIIQGHPQIGFDILKEVDFPWPIARMVIEHHERMDGSGYPQGIPGKNIAVEARILAVADVVDAMSSHRPYRPALGIDTALSEITSNKGILYDPNVAEICLELFKEKYFKFEQTA